MRPIVPGLILFAGFTLSLSAQAHVSVVGAPAIANKSGIVELAIPHGCTVGEAHLDTVRVEVTVPASLTSLRPVYGDLGNVSISSEGSGASAVTRLVWSKPTGSALNGDTHYYSVKFRARMPDAPFTQIALPTTQYCLNGDEEVSVSWNEVSNEEHDHGSSASTGENPAPILMVYPARYPGWNQYTTKADQHLHDMRIFNDAEIVWWDNAAYSSNPATQAMITADPDVQPLAEIHDNATFWVKY